MARPAGQPTNRLERIQPSSLTGQYLFQDLYNREVYFDDFDDRSGNYFRLSFDPSFVLHGGKNLIAIRGNSDTMALESEILIEAIDAAGELVKTQVYDLNDDAHNRVISIDITPETAPGDLRFTILGTATEAPDGSRIPPDFINVTNFRWTRQFTAKPKSSNTSKIIYNQFKKPVIEIKEIKKPFFQLQFNQALSQSVSAGFNPTSSYVLSSSVNTEAKVSYRKSGGKYFLTANNANTNYLDFGGFTQDMEGGIVIVKEPQNPRPSSVNGYNSTPVYAETEQGDGIFDETTGEFVQGSYLSTITEVISPFELRVATPHTTFQGLTAANYQEFEHFEFENSDFELIWSEMPISYSADPTGSSGDPLLTSYAHVTFNNLEPLTGDVTRIKCYMKNHQAPFDWVLASDMAVEAQELLYRKDFQKYRAPIGDFTPFGVAHDGINSVLTYWTASGVGTSDPSMSLYTQQSSQENPPVGDNIKIGTNQQAWELDGTAYWEFKALESASFFENQWYELSFKAVSVKTQLPSWTTLTQTTVAEPKVEVYMTGSAFTEANTGLGKFIGLIEDTAVRKKHVEFDQDDDEKEVGYKFVFQADGTEFGIPKFKIESGVWHFYDISIKPWDRKGYTPGTFDVIFPTIKCNVGNYDSLDFKFEFYNDDGMISNYPAIIERVPWENELTATFTNVVTNTISGSTGSFGNINTSVFTGPTVFSTGPFTFNGAATFSSGISASGPNIFGGPLTLGTACSDIVAITGSVYIPCITEGASSDNIMVIGSDYLVQSSSLTISDIQNIQGFTTVSGQSGANILSSNTQQVTFTGTGGITVTTLGSNVVISSSNSGSGGSGGGDNNQNAFSTYSFVGGGTHPDVIAHETASTIKWEAGCGIGIDTVDTTSAGNADVIKIYATHSFASFSLAGSDPIVADTCGDNVTLVAGSNMNISFDVGSDTITFDSTGGGGGGGCCSQCGLAIDTDGNVGIQDCTGQYGITTQELNYCPQTLGFFKPLMSNQQFLAANYAENYAEPTWLQVNNWPRADNKIYAGRVGYAAIFNTTGIPSDRLDASCCAPIPGAGGMNSFDQAGHGIKVMTSTIPTQIPLKGNTNSCQVNNPINSPNFSTPIGNAFLISFFHYDARCDGAQNAFNAADSSQMYIGGVRKDCQNYSNTVIYEQVSDKRRKENIVPTKWGVDDLMKVRVRDFDFKSTPEERRNRKTVGLIAQELEEIFPQAVSGDPHGNVDEDPMTVSLTEMVPLLIKSVQDQQKTIKELEDRIKKMEEK